LQWDFLIAVSLDISGTKSVQLPVLDNEVENDENYSADEPEPNQACSQNHGTAESVVVFFFQFGPPPLFLRWNHCSKSYSFPTMQKTAT
jgi:hypothetical protein